MADAGPLTPAELAERTRYQRAVHPRMAQRPGGRLVCHLRARRAAGTGCPPSRPWPSPTQTSPAYLPGVFQLALGAVLDSPRVCEAARTGRGIGWHDHVPDVHEGCERFFRPGYNAHLMAEWLPALDGVVTKLEQGASVADVGCGHGASTLLMARGFPTSTFVGFDYHDESIATAQQRAAAGRPQPTGPV